MMDQINWDQINWEQIKKDMSEVEKDLLLVVDAENDVWKEVKRQRKLYGVQRHSNNDWLPILIEEIGEVSEALQKNTIAAKQTDKDDLYTELIQVAAVAISWAAATLDD